MAITATVLPLLLERVDGVWPDNQHTADLTADVEVLNAIKANQTSKIDIIIGNEKDRDVKVGWMKACPPTPTDCVDSCTFAGEEASTDSQTYALSKCIQTEFKVDIDGFYANEFEATDAAAELMLAHLVGHANAAAQYAVSKINTFAGTNTYDNQAQWTINGTTTEVPGVQWDSSLFGALRRAATKNKLLMPYLLTGENLDQEAFMAATNRANGEGKGDATRFGSLPIYVDLFNIEDVNTSGNVISYISYLISKGALAFASKGYYSERPEKVDGRDAHTRLKMANKFFDMLMTDVQITTSCSSGHTYEHYKLKSKFDVFRNPLGCESGRTGILKFKNTGI